MVFFRINDVDIRKACKSPKMRLLSKLLVTLQPQWALFVENMQSTQLKVKMENLFLFWLLRSQGRCSSGANLLLRSRVGAPQELWLLRSHGRCSSGAPSGSVLLRSQGRCS